MVRLCAQEDCPADSRGSGSLSATPSAFVITACRRRVTMFLLCPAKGALAATLCDAPVYGALDKLGQPTEPVITRPEPAVPIRKSVTPDYIICLEDGKTLKMLKRHLASAYNMTPDQYRERWGCRPTTRWWRRTMPSSEAPRQEDRPWHRSRQGNGGAGRARAEARQDTARPQACGREGIVPKRERQPGAAAPCHPERTATGFPDRPHC